MVRAVFSSYVTRNHSTSNNTLSPNVHTIQRRQRAGRSVVSEPAVNTPEPQLWTIQTTELLSIVFSKRALSDRRQAEGAVVCLAPLHRRRQNRRVVQTEQVTNLVRESRFEIVGAGCAVGGKLKLSSILSAWSRIDADIGFGDVAGFRIEEDARASGRGFGVECLVFGCDRDRQETDSITSFRGTDGSRLRPCDDEVDIRKTGPASQCAARGAGDVAIGFDVRAGRKQGG